jgi:hypothetical protein
LKNLVSWGAKAWLVSTLAIAQAGMFYQVKSEDAHERIGMDTGGCGSFFSQRIVLVPT